MFVIVMDIHTLTALIIQEQTCQQTHLFKSNFKKLSRTVAIMETTLYESSYHGNTYQPKT